MGKIILGGLIFATAYMVFRCNYKKTTYQEILGPCMPKGGDGASAPCPAWIRYGKQSN